MRKLFCGLFVTVLACFVACGAAFAAQPVLDKPAPMSFTLENDSLDEVDAVIILRFPVPQSIRNYAAQAEKEAGAPNLLIEFDTRMDGGKWFLDRKAGGRKKSPLQEELLDQFKYRFLVYDPDAESMNVAQYESEFEAFMFEYDSWDWDNHSHSFRYRYVYEQVLPGPVWVDRASPWSDEITVGKRSK